MRACVHAAAIWRLSPLSFLGGINARAMSFYHGATDRCWNQQASLLLYPRPFLFIDSHRPTTAVVNWPIHSATSSTFVQRRTFSSSNNEEPRPFRILGVQQIAIGSDDRTSLNHLWKDILGLMPHKTNIRMEKENVVEDSVQVGMDALSQVEIDLMTPIDVEAHPRVHTKPLHHVGLWVDHLADAVEWMAARGVRFTPGTCICACCGKTDLENPRTVEKQTVDSCSLAERSILRSAYCTHIPSTSLSRAFPVCSTRRYSQGCGGTRHLLYPPQRQRPTSRLGQWRVD